MKKSTIVILLVLIVGAVFFFKPDLLGQGDKDMVGSIPPLSVAPAPDTMTIPTNEPCQTVQQCKDYALTLDPNAKDVQATCTGKCNFIVEKFPTVEVTP